MDQYVQEIVNMLLTGQVDEAQKMRKSSEVMANAHLIKARTKHPEFGKDSFDEVLNEELEEMFEAIAKGDKIHAYEEAFDVIAVLLRFVEGDK